MIFRYGRGCSSLFLMKIEQENVHLLFEIHTALTFLLIGNNYNCYKKYEIGK